MRGSLNWAGTVALAATLWLAPGAMRAAHAASPAPQLKRAATVAFLMPDQASTRYVTYDIPDFKKDMKQLCPSCTVIAADANGDANLQRTQAEAAIAKNAIAIVVDPVDAAAARGWVQQAMARGVKVIAYDRPFAQMKVDYYVSFNNETVGRMLAEPMVEHLKSANLLADGKGILIVNGSPTDAAAMLIKKGIHDAVDPSGIKVLAEYDTPDWEPSKARAWVGSQISRFGDKIAAVIAANDGTGTAAAAALEAGGLKPVPPVTGNDATLAGVQLVLLRRMWDTISKPGATEAWAAANAVVALVQNEKVPLLEGGKEVTLFNTPSQLFKPTVIMPDNIQKDIVDMGFLKASDICTARYQAACQKYGVK